MSEPFIGEIMMVAFDFAPRTWALCQGQTMPINQNQALFSLLGTTYGGNGVTTFQLPDLRARTAVHEGNDNGIPPVQLGEVGGVPSVALQPTQVPAHSHSVLASSTTGSTLSPVNGYLGGIPNAYIPSSTKVVSISPASVSSAGNGTKHENRQPFLGINYIIALSGIFPSRT